jgi:signal transduction histidine kinase
VRIEITDTGPGIPPDVLPHIFEPFFTTKDEGEGTGLGLSLVYGIVENHGGQIKAFSEPGQGAAFVIELPVTPKSDGDRAGEQES